MSLDDLKDAATNDLKELLLFRVDTIPSGNDA